MVNMKKCFKQGKQNCMKIKLMKARLLFSYFKKFKVEIYMYMHKEKKTRV